MVIKILKEGWYSTITAANKRELAVRGISLVILFCLIITLTGCSQEAPAGTYSPKTSISKVPVKTTSSATPTVSQSIVKAPEVFPIKIKTSLISSGLNLNVQAMLFNANSAPVELDNITAVIKEANGDVCIQGSYPGGVMEATNSHTFSFTMVLPRQYLTEDTLNLEIASQTINADTTFPIKSSTKINVPEILKKAIVCPKINLQANITKIANIANKNQLITQVEGSLINTNPVDFTFSMVDVQIKNKEGVLQDWIIPGNTLPAKENMTFSHTFLIPIEILNQTDLKAYAYSNVQFPNYIQSINFTKEISIPKLIDLIILPQMTFTVDEEWKTDDLYRVTVKGIMNNDNEFDLTTVDFKLKMYDNSTGRLKESDTMSPIIIKGIPAGGTRSVIFKYEYLKTDINKGFEALITGDTQIGLEGIKETLPVSGKLIYKLEPLEH